jgi:aspartate--ammonia ligase
MAVSHPKRARRATRKQDVAKNQAQPTDPERPGVGDYAEVEKVLPTDYRALLDRRETQLAVFAVKSYVEEQLCKELNLMMVTVPLIVDAESGVNDPRDRNGSRTPIQFHITNDHDRHSVDAQVVQAATKWKRMALKQFGMAPGQGLCTDMRAVRKDYFLDHDHSCYVDQWDWELAITEDERHLGFLTATVRKIWKIIKGAEQFALEHFPKLRDSRYPDLPDEVTFLHAEDVLDMFPGRPSRLREALVLQKYPALFVFGIGWPLRDGYPHEWRAADYDDWATETESPDGRPMHGLNGDLLVWNPVTQRRHGLASVGIRVNAETLEQQLTLSNQLQLLKTSYHRAIMENALPLSIGGGIGQGRTQMLLLRKAHLGEVTVSVWPKVLKDMCAARNIVVLE